MSTLNSESKKIIFFEALVYELLQWYKSDNSNPEANDLSKLKLLKLLFLGVSKEEKYLEVFNFVSWALGPIEKDIYKSINNSIISKFIINNNCTTTREIDYKPTGEALLFAQNVIDMLKEKNPNLISLSAFSLVDITHKWNCWNITQNFGIEEIPKNLILSENGYFS